MQGSAGQGYSVSLVIPAFNEEAGIATAIAEADEALQRITNDYEILVVDDGSRDGTFTAATAAASNRPHVRILRHEINRGYGAALRTGFEAACKECVAFTDADCQFDLADLARLVPLTDRAPIVAGFRVRRQDPWRRRMLSKGYNLIARTLLGTRVRDCDCALKVFRREALHHLLPNSTNFFVNTEMLAKARQQKLDVIEVGVRHRPRLRGQSSVSMADVPKTLATLLPFWWSSVMFPVRSSQRQAPRGGLLELALVLVIALLLFFARLGTPLIEAEEGRFAEIPRQLLAEPGSTMQLSQPPLMSWLVMTSYRLFGIHDWSARLVPGLASVLTIAIAWWWARQLAGRRAALLGALLLAFSPGFIYAGRLLTPGIVLALFTITALAAGHTAMLAERRRSWLWLVCGMATGFGLLTAGPITLALTLPPLLLLALLDPRSQRPGLGSLLLVLLPALAMAAPWFNAQGLRVDGQWPIGSLLLGLAPWLILLPALLRDLILRDAAPYRPAALGALLLFAVWALLVSPSAVIALVPLALGLGVYLDGRLPADGWEVLWRYRNQLAYWSTAVVLLLGTLGAFGSLAAGMNEPNRAVLLAMLAGLALAVLLTRGTSRQASWALAGSTGLLMMLAVVHTLLPEHANRFSLRHPVRMHAWKATAGDTPVACYPQRFDSVAFYIGRSDIREVRRGEQSDLVDPTLLFVQTQYLDELLSELPPDMEFVQRSSGLVTVGELRPRREAPHWRLAIARQTTIMKGWPD